MAHHGILRDYRFSDDVDDIRGATLYGLNDEKLGKIDDIIFDHSSGTIQYAVVDAGGWFSSKKFVVPAERIRPYGNDSDDFTVDMSKQQIESLPRYDEDRFGKNKEWNQENWDNYDKDYRKSLETSGGVLHREDSTHTITPTPDELPATGSAMANEDAYLPDRVAGTFPDTAPNANKIRMRPSGIAARAEDTAAPGIARQNEIPTELEENELDESHDVITPRQPLSTRTSTPVGTTTGSMSNRVANTDTNDLVDVDDRRRSSRWGAFEDHLRRNRVDITASCRSCGTKRDRAA